VEGGGDRGTRNTGGQLFRRVRLCWVVRVVMPALVVRCDIQFNGTPNSELTQHAAPERAQFARGPCEQRLRDVYWGKYRLEKSNSTNGFFFTSFRFAVLSKNGREATLPKLAWRQRVIPVCKACFQGGIGNCCAAVKKHRKPRSRSRRTLSTF